MTPAPEQLPALDGEPRLGPGWEAWAPPLDPPSEGGLPHAEAEQIAEAWWPVEPHLCAALQWEAWAARLPPAASVSSVQTGAQSVTYSPATASGQLGPALARAAWHRAQLSTLHSVELAV